VEFYILEMGDLSIPRTFLSERIVVESGFFVVLDVLPWTQRTVKGRVCGEISNRPKKIFVRQTPLLKSEKGFFNPSRGKSRLSKGSREISSPIKTTGGASTL